jgi:hypothetical protein
MGARRLRHLLLVAPLLCACIDQARVYPMDQASLQAGVPKIEFVRQGLGAGGGQQ